MCDRFFKKEIGDSLLSIFADREKKAADMQKDLYKK